MVIFHKYGENINGSECGCVNQATGSFLLPAVLLFLPFLPLLSFFPFRISIPPGCFVFRWRYQLFTVCIRVVEQFIEHIGRKGFTQA